MFACWRSEPGWRRSSCHQLSHIFKAEAMGGLRRLLGDLRLQQRPCRRRTELKCHKKLVRVPNVMMVQKLSACFPLVALLPPGRRDALQTEKEKYSNADKEKFSQKVHLFYFHECFSDTLFQAAEAGDGSESQREQRLL